MLIRKVEFIKLLNLSKPGVRRSFIFVEPLHFANYQIHRTSEFIEISNSWKPQIHRTLGPSLGPSRPSKPHKPLQGACLTKRSQTSWFRCQIFWPTTYGEYYYYIARVCRAAYYNSKWPILHLTMTKLCDIQHTS